MTAVCFLLLGSACDAVCRKQMGWCGFGCSSARPRCSTQDQCRFCQTHVPCINALIGCGANAEHKRMRMCDFACLCAQSDGSLWVAQGSASCCPCTWHAVLLHTAACSDSAGGAGDTAEYQQQQGWLWCCNAVTAIVATTSVLPLAHVQPCNSLQPQLIVFHPAQPSTRGTNSLTCSKLDNEHSSNVTP